jgi:hypothetical protein
MAERDQFAPGVGSGIYGSGEPVGNIVFNQATGIPPAPQNLIASDSDYTDKVTLTWYNVGSANSYNVYRDFELIFEKISGTLLGDTNDSVLFEDTTAIPGILYNYYVTSVNNSGESVQSNIDTGSVKLQTVTGTATTNSFNNKIVLTWSSVTGAVFYKIYRSSTNEFTQETELVLQTAQTQYEDTNVFFGQTFYYFIIASSGLEESDSTVSAGIQGSVSSIPETPIVIASDGAFTTHVRLDWNFIQNVGSYKIYRDDVEIFSTTALFFLDTTAQPGVLHNYYVLSQAASSSVFETGCDDFGSRKLDITNANLVASVGQFENKISLSWNQIEGATVYKIYRATTPTNPLQNMSLIATTSEFTYDDINTDLSYETNYWYAIIASCQNTVAESDLSNVTLGALLTPVPSAPTGLTASSGTYTNKIVLNWNSVPNSTYEVFRDSTTNRIASNITTTTFEDLDGSTNQCQQFTYFVRATNQFNKNSSFSTSATGYKKLSAPSGLSATDAVFTQNITVTWNSVPGALTYDVYRSITPSTSGMVNIGTISASPYIDTNTDLTVGQTYYYSVTASCALSTSDYSNIDSGILDDPTVVIPVPNTPTGLSATKGTSTTQVQLSWTPVTSTPLTGYKIFRDGVQIATTTAITFTDSITAGTGFTVGTQFTYSVKAFNVSGDSSSSTTDTGFAKLASPTGLGATRGTIQQHITLNWTASTGATLYKIFRKVAGGSFSQIDTTTTTTYNDTNTDLTYNTPFYYKVVAASAFAAAESGFSNQTYGLLKPPSPGSFNITSASDGTNTSGVNITWSPSEHAYGGYKIYKIDTNGETPIGDAPSNLFTSSDSMVINAPDFPPINWVSYTQGGSGLSFGTSTKVMPDSSTNGKKVTFISHSIDINNGLFHLMPSPEINQTYTVSLWAGTETGNAKFRLSYFNGSTSIFSGNFEASTTMTRFSWTFTASTNNFTSNIAIANSNDSTSPLDVVFWGAQLEKGSSANSYISTTTQPLISTSFTDTSIPVQTTREYRIKAINSTGTTNSTNTDIGFKKPTTPVITQSSTDTSNRIRIQYSSGTLKNGSATIKIYRGIDSNTNDSTNDITFSLLTSYSDLSDSGVFDDTDVTLVPGKKYFYTIKTQFNGVESEFSNTVFGIKTNLAAAQNLNDYKVWAYHFGSNQGGGWTSSGAPNNDSMFGTLSPLNHRFAEFTGGNWVYNTNYIFKGIAPYIRFPMSSASQLGGSGASATATINAAGEVTNITINSGGSQYSTDSLPEIRFSGTATRGAIGKAVVSGGGSITSIVIIDSGSGYTTAPTITISSNKTADGRDRSMGGYRHPTNTTYLLTSGDSAIFTNMANAQKTIPVGKRILNGGEWWFDFNPARATVYNYYAGIDYLQPGAGIVPSVASAGEPSTRLNDGTPIRDGTVYNGVKFGTLWYDNNLIDAKESFNAFLQKLKAVNFVFDYYDDDREHQGFYYLNHGYNTIRWKDILGNGNRSRTVACDTDSNWASWSPTIYSDSRVISALVNDSRFTTKINPSTGKTFSQQFIEYFYLLLNNDPLYNGTDRLSSMHSSHPSFTGFLTTNDIIKVPFTQTTFEASKNFGVAHNNLIFHRPYTARPSDNSPFTQKVAATAPSFVAISSTSDYDWRCSPYNYWSIYSCATREGTGCPNVVIPKLGGGQSSYAPCGHIGTENNRKDGYASLATTGTTSESYNEPTSRWLCDFNGTTMTVKSRITATPAGTEPTIENTPPSLLSTKTLIPSSNALPAYIGDNQNILTGASTGDVLSSITGSPIVVSQIDGTPGQVGNYTLSTTVTSQTNVSVTFKNTKNIQLISPGTVDPEIKTWWDNIGQNKITGYALAHFAADAWNATVDSWLLDYYYVDHISPCYDTNNPEFNHVKWKTYEFDPVNEDDYPFWQGNYGVRMFRKITNNQITGNSYYNAISPLIFESVYNNDLTFVPVATTGNDDIKNIRAWNEKYARRSGYLKKPIGTDTRKEMEKYAWSAYSQTAYGGFSCNSGLLVKYPETILHTINADGSNALWIGNQNDAFGRPNHRQFKLEIIYKSVVDWVKKTRFSSRANPTRFSPYITDGPQIAYGGPSVFMINGTNSFGYWYELCFHLLCHLGTDGIINIFRADYNSNGDLIMCQLLLDDWRNQSLASPCLPCSNSTGDSSLKCDRLDLSDCFEKYLISGVKLTDTNTYLWRITIPPKFFDKNGIAILDRDPTETNDIPQTLTINSNFDITNKNSTDVMRSRGVWVKRNFSTPPKYVPRTPTP